VSLAYYARIAVTLWQPETVPTDTPCLPILLRITLAVGAAALILLSLMPAIVS